MSYTRSLDTSARSLGGPLYLRRYERDYGDTVEYVYSCEACDLRAPIGVSGRLVRRDPGDDEPAPAPSAPDAWVLADALMGGPEKRRRRREIEGVEADVERRARWLLRQAGCPHTEPCPTCDGAHRAGGC